MLEALFQLQAELNRRIGMDTASMKDHFDPQVAGRWINDYLAAMGNELEELRDCTFWKHWCAEARQGRRFELHDLQNARVEVIDMLFFWISLAQCVGLDAADVADLYRQKLGINHARQDQDYAMSTKTEDDNRTVVLNPEGSAPDDPA
ncbi:MAG: dUTPase [Phycisphaerae bacterium]|nr:dUTPase [Phycisphaerae bacterium]